ncbi:glycosyltransferase family 39 protein [Flavobacterium sp.]|uniref:glycosyltransferase family 39 protein n=1 Tax=Flavobacterium sp. TaxID=239 RepID=UPI002FD919DC
MNDKSLSLSFIKALLLFSVTVFGITEFLSLIGFLDHIGVILSWSFVNLVLFFLSYKKGLYKNILSKIKSQIEIFKTSKQSFKILLCITILIIIGLFFQGFVYPPNNWDSLTYHMSRIMYWIGNGSVDHFQTHILRHLYQPPFAEYVILNLNLANGNDYFSNNVQGVYLIGCLFVAIAILKEVGVSENYKLFVCLLILNTPSVLLQATTTKNDIVVAFFILTTIHFFRKIIQSNQPLDFIFLGLSIGLGMLTKSTFYVFTAPIILILGISFLYKNVKTKSYFWLTHSIIAIVIALSINTTHFYRNYKVDQDILNIDKNEAKGYSNESMSVSFFTSNCIKNIGLHLGYPFQDVFDKGIRKWHEKNNIDINNPKLNYLGIPYEGARKLTTHEDYVPNTFQFLFIFCAFLFTIYQMVRYRKISLFLLSLWGILILQIILFVLFLKWQPWHTRLHIPLFIESCIILVLTFKEYKIRRLTGIIVLTICLTGFIFYFVYNNLRPLIKHSKYTKDVSFYENRYRNYFSNQLNLHGEYKKIKESIIDNTTIGLFMSDWEYPLFKDFYYDHIKLKAINVLNNTNRIKQDELPIDQIISNTINQPFIEYQGKKYYNQNFNNLYIWSYK